MKRWWLFLFLPILAVPGGCGRMGSRGTSSELPAASTPAPGSRIEIGYVLHGLNDFTQVIKQGAEDAGKTLGVDVEVTGPAGFVATEAIGMFEGMVQKKKDGLVVVPQPGEVWVSPIREAVAAGIPVMTANVTSADSAASAWFGQDEYQSGVLLAKEFRKELQAGGWKEDKIVVGMCAPGVDVLVKRYAGFKKGMEGARYSVTRPFDVTAENTSNYSTWENLASANADMAAAVGLCSVDIPNLAKLKSRSGAKWLIGGYDLNVESLDAIKSGAAQVTIGQHPYLQGYLPVLALVQHLRDGKPLVKGWVNVGTEVVTRENVDQIYQREANKAAASPWYADYIRKQFADLNALARPLPGRK
jgi:ABC-type sugar transport system substrate-binding protein